MAAAGLLRFEDDVAAWLRSQGPGRILALVGGGALLLGMAFFLSLAFSRGWITPELRVAMGLLAGFGLLPVGALLLDRANPTLGYVVVAVGLGTIELALFAARLFNLAPPEVALIGALVAATVAGYIAVRRDSQLVAGMAIIAVLAAPPIVSAPPSLVTVGFLGVVLVASAYVALGRNWPLLAWLAFALTAPQLYLWAVGDVDRAIATIGLGAYWALFATTAVVPLLLNERRPKASGITLLAAIGGFITATAYFAFRGNEQWLAGSLIAALGAANLATGYGLVRRRGLRDDVTHAALGMGVALALVAAALLLSANGIVVAWTLVMTAVALVGIRFDLYRARVAALGIGALTALMVVRLFSVEPMLVEQAADGQQVPYLDANGLVLGLFLVALTVVGWYSRNNLWREWLVAIGVAVAAATVPFASASDLGADQRPGMMTAAWLLLGLIALGADRLRHATWSRVDSERPAQWTGLIVGGFGMVGVAQHGRLLDLIGTPVLPAVPFTDEATLFTAAGTIAMWALAASRTDLTERTSVLCASLLLPGLLLYQELPLEWAIVGWSAFALIIAALAPVSGRPSVVSNGTLAAFATAMVVATLLAVAPPTRLVVQAPSPGYALALAGGPPNAATVALLGAIGGLAAVTWRERRVWGTLRVAGFALVPLIYLLSVGLVDFFAARVPAGDALALDEITKQAHVALTTMWALIGLALLSYGLARDYFPARAAALILLGSATVKAFIFDLAALDVAYRVLSMIGLGVLLLVGAYGYQRVRRQSRVT